MVKIEIPENEVIDQEIKVEGVSNNSKRKSSDSEESSAIAILSKNAKFLRKRPKLWKNMLSKWME